MTKEEALKVLGLEADAPAEVVKYTADKLKADLQSKLASAPTEAVKDKFQQFLDKVISAEQSLIQGSSQPSVPKSNSPLSQTKMADIPGMAPVTGDSMADENAQMFQPGNILANRYEIKEFIDAGGMGEVYRAFDKTRDKDIALKVMRPAMLANEQAKERFLNEAKLSSELSHPNIVNVFDVAQEGEYYFLTMELLQGQSLRGFITNHQTLRQQIEIEEAIEITRKIADALHYAHKYTVHRDIKPENIWLTEDGEVKLMDFGIARMLSTSQMTQTGASMGTAYYMAPEQIKGRGNIDGRADQFSLTVVLYEMLAGEIPAGRIEPAHTLRKEIPKVLSMNIDKALSAKPEDRFEDMAVFSEALAAKGGAGLSLPAMSKKTVGISAVVLIILLLLISAVIDGYNKAEEKALRDREVAVQSQRDADRKIAEQNKRRANKKAKEKREENAKAIAKRKAEDKKQKQQAAATEARRKQQIAKAKALGEEGLYKKAFELLKSGDYHNAISEFNLYRTIYPYGIYSGYALYWIGVTHYVQGKSSLALSDFKKVISKYPESTKLPGAYLKIGYIHHDMKNCSLARSALNFVVREYSGSKVAKEAKERLERIENSGC